MLKIGSGLLAACLTGLAVSPATAQQQGWLAPPAPPLAVPAAAGTSVSGVVVPTKRQAKCGEKEYACLDAVRDAAIKIDKLGFEKFCMVQNDKADRERRNLEEIFAGASSLQKSSVTHGPPPAVDYLCNRHR